MDEKSVVTDQLASSEASLSGCTPFSKECILCNEHSAFVLDEREYLKITHISQPNF